MFCHSNRSVLKPMQSTVRWRGMFHEHFSTHLAPCVDHSVHNGKYTPLLSDHCTQLPSGQESFLYYWDAHFFRNHYGVAAFKQCLPHLCLFFCSSCHCRIMAFVFVLIELFQLQFCNPLFNNKSDHIYANPLVFDVAFTHTLTSQVHPSLSVGSVQCWLTHRTTMLWRETVPLLHSGIFILAIEQIIALYDLELRRQCVP